MDDMDDMDDHIKPVDLSRASRIVNHGPTVLVSARHGGIDNVMAVAWCCGLDFNPPKLTVVLDRITHTRSLVEGSGRFVVQVPNVAQLQLTEDIGTHSFYDDPNKLAAVGVSIFDIAGQDLPFVKGCSAWLACELIREPHIQNTYDLFLGQVTAAWADGRVFKDGRWHFETAGPEWRSLHHVAGGHYYAIGDAMDADRTA